MTFSAVSMIVTKRWNRRPHSEEELEWWIDAFAKGEIPDYQVSAWLMAVCWQGMTPAETACLTKCMVQSGRVLSWPTGSITVDKHSTGGVGDKISLILAPLVVATAERDGYSLQVPMMAGRGLDHTGGTLDKLESIPGYQTNLEGQAFQSVVQSVGCSIVSAGPDMVLADRKLYALRDVTGTVSSIPLQTASIVSKKIAEGPASLVLDVKYGRAAFQASQEEAQELAQSMISTAELNGVKPTTAFLTRMDHPIGHAVGNWLEVKECVEVMKDGHGDKALVQLMVVQAAQMLQQSGVFPEECTFQDFVDKALDTLRAGLAFQKFRQMAQAHGGDVDVLDHPDSYPKSKYSRDILVPQDGYISDVDALQVGRTAVYLGAGRSVADAPVNMTAGILFQKKVGDKVTKGDVVAVVHGDIEHVMETATERIQNAISYSETAAVVPSIITHRVSAANGTEEFVMPAQLQ